MRIIIAIAFSLALVECRRHLCDDMTRPVCPGGAKAVYNRPTGKNTRGSTYFPPPTCPGQNSPDNQPFCVDGSTPAFRFNTCKYEELKCPNGQGMAPHCPGGGLRCDRPFRPCIDGSACSCPGDGRGCAFVHKRCANGDKCHRQCKTGQPHCPWFTKNRNKHDGIRIFNTGDHRPGNKEGGHNWGGDFPGNRPYPDLVRYGPFGRLAGDREHFTDRFASQNGDLPITQVDVFQGSYLGHKDVIVGIQFYYDGTPGELHGKSTGDSVSLSLGAGETIEKITIRSLEDGFKPLPNNFIFFLQFETSAGTTVSTKPTGRGKMHVIPQVRDNVIPRQDNDIPGGTGLAFITGYTVTDTPRGVLGQLNFFFHYP